MKCSSCGYENREGVTFCEECGGRLASAKEFEYYGECVKCGAPLLKGGRFCVECGKPVARQVEDQEPISYQESQTLQSETTYPSVVMQEAGPINEPEPGEKTDNAAVQSLKPRVRLRLFVDEQKFKLQFLDQPEKEIVVDFNEPYISERTSVMRELEKGWFSTPTLLTFHQRVGKQLYWNLFPKGKSKSENIRDLVRKHVDAATDMKLPLLVQLEFDADAVSPAQLPWELLYDGSRHLALSEVIHLNRYITYFGDRGPFEPVEQLNILYVISRPNDQTHLPDYYEANELREVVSNLMQKGRVRMDVLEAATLAEMEKAVKNGNYHIIHWDGHGGFIDGVGMLCFENETNQTAYISASQLAEVLQGSSVRLVLLSACQSAMVGRINIFNTFGPALIRNKIPAVIAFQYTVPVTSTAAFAKEFYRSIVRGEPISSAVADGRKAMAGLTSTWFFPSLYMRVADGEGYLFTGEPEEHKRQRMQDLMELAKRWAVMVPAIQALYQEGGPSWMGEELSPDGGAIDGQRLGENSAEAEPENLTPGSDSEINSDSDAQTTEKPKQLAVPALVSAVHRLETINVPEIGEMVLIPGGHYSVKFDPTGFAAVEKILSNELGYPITAGIYSQADYEFDLEPFYISRRPLRWSQYLEYINDTDKKELIKWVPGRQVRELEIKETPKQIELYKLQRVEVAWIDYVQKQLERWINQPEWWYYFELAGVGDLWWDLIQESGEGTWNRHKIDITRWWKNAPFTPGITYKSINIHTPAGKIKHLEILEKIARELNEINPESVVGDPAAFISWLNKRHFGQSGHNGKQFRTPGKDEWVAAAQGFEPRNYPWGNDWIPTLFMGTDQYEKAASPFGVLGISCGDVNITPTTLEWATEALIRKGGSPWGLADVPSDLMAFWSRINLGPEIFPGRGARLRVVLPK